MKIIRLLLLLVVTMTPRLISQPTGDPPELSTDLECTSFCLDNSGYAIFGSNYDHPKDIPDGLVFVNKRNVQKSIAESDSYSEHAQWTSKYGSVTFNLVAREAAFAGMNEAGLVVSLMALRESISPEPDRRRWIHSYFWLQYVLDNFSTVEEIIASNSSVRIQGKVPPYLIPHYFASDKHGNCAVIEFLNGTMITHSGKNLPVKALANSTYDTSVSEWKKITALMKNGKPVQSRNSSLRRFFRAAERVSSYKPTDSHAAVETAFNILDEVSGQKIQSGPTRWSLVFDTKNLRINFRTILHRAIREIDFAKLDFSCKTPVKMLDINAKLSGEVTSRLEDYSFKKHLTHALKARKKWGMKETPDELERQILMFDAFKCK
jgi:penicillin V acylase-like amidase (Ntn superfamily)